MEVLHRERTAVQLATPDRLRRFGARPALFDGRWTSYEALADLVERRIDQIGPTKTVVAVPERRDVSTVAWMLAALGGGHVLLMHDERGGDILRTYQPGRRIVRGRLKRKSRPMDLHPDLAMLLSTSGTTGSPKLVRLSAEGVDANAAAIAGYLGLRPDDRAITTLPLSYCYGLSVLTSHLHAGAGLVLTDLSVVDDCFWDLASATNVTTLAGVPHTFDLMPAFDGRNTLPSLRRVTQAGGRMPAVRVREMALLAQRQAWDFYVMYGQTEATARMAYLPPELAADNPDCVGVAVPGGTLRIDAGEVVFSGPNVMLGYATSVDHLARGRDLYELRTGDLGEFTDEGLLRITGRAANRAKLFGLRIDLDHVAELHPGSVALVAGEELVLVVEAAVPNGLERRLQEATGLPARVVAVEQIPRLTSGKPDRRRLAQIVTMPEDEAPVDRLEGVREALARTLRKPVASGDSFVSLGGDSMAYVAASVRLERVLGELPRGWHLMTAAELAGQEPAPRAMPTVETSVVLRAIAVLLVVASHTSLINVRGGAHLLLALAGFNFARFVLPSTNRAQHMGRALAGFVIPAALWLALVIGFSQEYGAAVLGVTFSDTPADNPAWRYWFVEVFTLALLLAALVAVPRRLAVLERRRPLAFAGVTLGVAVVGREVFAGETVPTSLFTLAASMWVFVLGWFIGVLRDTLRARLAATVLILALVVPFFENPTRDIVIGLGLVLLVWVPSLRMPRCAIGALSSIAAASLVIYLTHWQVYPPFEQWPVLATAISLGFGVAAYAGLRRLRVMR